MRVNLKVALTASAGLGMMFLAACSDSATAPNSGKVVTEVNLAAGDATSATAVTTLLKICKVGDASGTFTITDVADGAGGSGNPDIVDDDAVTAGNQLTLTPGTDVDPNCVIAVEDLGDASQLKSDHFTVTETTAPGVTTETTCFLAGSGEQACPAQFVINTAHGWTILVRNTAPPPPPTGCTYTKGWYRNNGSSTVIAVDGRSVADAQAIFNATPGKPGTVTFGGDNTLLNLYQQLLAALNNLGGDPLAGPDDVDDAIADALAGTGGAGTNITTTLTQTEMSDLIDVLSDFNEGTFEGWPHCDDVVVN